MSMPGYGDEATWGPVTGTNDPRYVEFSGDVHFKCQIGEGRATVEVWASIVCDEFQITSVEYDGTEVLPILGLDSLEEIEKHYRTKEVQ